MTMTELVFAQALLMAPDLSTTEQHMLQMMCHAAVTSLERKLRNNLAVKDCQNEFVSAASMYALAAMSEISEENQFEQISTGDLTLRRGNGTLASNCLRNQADMIMAPFVKLGMVFMGV